MAAEGGGGNPTSRPSFEGDEASVLKRQLRPRPGAGLLTSQDGDTAQASTQEARTGASRPHVQTQTGRSQAA